MSIVTFYCGDPKNAPKTTQGAHLGGNPFGEAGLGYVARAAVIQRRGIVNVRNMNLFPRDVDIHGDAAAQFLYPEFHLGARRALHP